MNRRHTHDPIPALIFLIAAFCAAAMDQSESMVSCASLADLKIEGVEITRAAPIPAGTTVPPMFSGGSSSGPLPAHCRVDGVINRRKGDGGVEFGIGFALALPEKDAWNGDFMMQGGGGGNGNTKQFQYDAPKRLIKTVYPDGTTVTNEYDGPGNLAGVTDRAGNII